MNVNYIKNIIKLLLIVLLIAYSLYILFYRPKKNIENYSNTYDCSKCYVKPYSGNCIKIYDLSYSLNTTDGSFELIDIDPSSDYIYCPFESDCLYDNLDDPENRINIDNEDISFALNKITCCSGENFYESYSYFYKDMSTFDKNISLCDALDQSLNDMPNDTPNDLNKYKSIIDNSGYLKVKSMCNTLKTYKEEDYPINKGLAFKRIIDRTEVIEKENNYDISENYYKYSILDQDLSMLSNTSYIDISDNVKIGCDGNLNELNVTTLSFEFSPEESYFGVKSDAPYTTAQDSTYSSYPNEKDLELQLQNLPSVSQTENVPVSVINQYLSQINSFYDKQLQNLLGPKTHNFDRTLQFDNDNLNIKETTFFTYDMCSNNTYDCNQGITGDENFKYCGPTAFNDCEEGVASSKNNNFKYCGPAPYNSF